MNKIGINILLIPVIIIYKLCVVLGGENAKEKMEEIVFTKVIYNYLVKTVFYLIFIRKALNSSDACLVSHRLAKPNTRKQTKGRKPVLSWVANHNASQ